MGDRKGNRAPRQLAQAWQRGHEASLQSLQAVTAALEQATPDLLRLDMSLSALQAHLAKFTLLLEFLRAVSRSIQTKLRQGLCGAARPKLTRAVLALQTWIGMYDSELQTMELVTAGLASEVQGPPMSALSPAAAEQLVHHHVLYSSCWQQQPFMAIDELQACLIAVEAVHEHWQAAVQPVQTAP